MSGEKGDWSAVRYQQHMNKLFLVFDLYFRTMKHMINIKMYRNCSLDVKHQSNNLLY
jgi:hypothetical protein